VLFCHLFITKQRRRTAIERSLGLSKALCTLSLLISVLVIVVPAYICGGVLSSYLTGAVAPSINAAQSAQAFDTRFSDWVNSADNDIAVSEQLFSGGSETGYLLAGAAVIPLSLLIAWGAVRGNLKEEPLKLLSEKER
jgi:ABC-type antimicrobial peptide transport system permease subunit